MRNKNVAEKAPNPTQTLEERIRHRAYALYQQRGCENGHDVEDWLQAEDELMGNKTGNKSAAVRVMVAA